MTYHWIRIILYGVTLVLCAAVAGVFFAVQARLARLIAYLAVAQGLSATLMMANVISCVVLGHQSSSSQLLMTIASIGNVTVAILAYMYVLQKEKEDGDR